jgi:hypothetical protein
MKGFFSVLLLFLAPVIGFSQNLSGVWRGSFQAEGSIMGMANRYKFEVQLVQNDKFFQGVTYSYLTTVFYGKATMSGSINPTTRKVLIEENKLVEVRMSGGTDACLMTLFLQYSKTGNEEYLQGTYSSNNVKDSLYCGRGTVILKKVQESDFYKEPFLVEWEKQKRSTPKIEAKPAPKPGLAQAPVPKKDTIQPKAEEEPPAKIQITPAVPIDTVKAAPAPVEEKKLPPPPPILRTRTNELAKTFTTNERKVILKIYDNGVIDNDTISVYHNNRLVISNQRLTDKAITLTIHLGPDDINHEIVMVAENLGDIPPNTAMMVVEMGPRRQEVHLTSTEQKNAKIIIKYEP